MVKKRFRLLLLLTAAAVGLVVVPASAETLLGNNVNSPELSKVNEVVSSDLAKSVTEQKSALNYWSPKRLRAASPIESPTPDLKAGDGLLKNVIPAQGANTSGLTGGLPALPAQSGGNEAKPTQPTQPQAKPQGDTGAATSETKSAASAKKWSMGGAITKSAGKAFFTLGGKDFMASATVIESQNHDTVITAGHVVNEGGGKFATNFVFKPAYHNGKAPYGTWTARTLKAPAEWTQNGNLNFDVGFAVLNKLNNKHVGDVVSRQKIAFNAGKGATVYSYGYPVYDPYDGETLQYCKAQLRPNQRSTKSTGQAITCNMTEGASGGALVTSMNSSGIGTVISVNSFSYSDELDVMICPALGDKAKAAYNAASRA